MVEPGYTMPMYSNRASQNIPMHPMPAYYVHQQTMGQSAEYSQAQGHTAPQVQAGCSSTQVQGSASTSSKAQGSVFPFTKERYDQIMQILNNLTSFAQANVDLFSGRVREIGRERDGLYFLQRHGVKKLAAVSLAATGIKSRHGDTDIDVALWHKLLGHLKSDVCVVLVQLVVFVQNQFDKTVKAVRNMALSIKDMCIYLSSNGVAERKCRYILEVKRTLRFQANIPIKYCGHCVLAALYGRAPTLEQLRTLGCLCYAKQVHEPDKFLYRAKPTVLIVFSDTQKVYVLLDLASRCFFINRDVPFREHIFPFKDTSTPAHHIFLPPGSSTYSEEQFPSFSTHTSSRHEDDDSRHESPL
ncbi:PREDICTED: uncharacterized protein LOC109231451 [Nicotiana attenuata]|uniref:uncharacterized protein LOC109231451 n=1 Tax=Nicotiana attenuata TaxID=49451 RepID=UPI0009047697|nr:PREDICTED: uncharacterized protein LOC109231451 [Nicotiana attenuata]